MVRQLVQRALPLGGIVYSQSKPPEWRIYARKYKNGPGSCVDIAYDEHTAYRMLSEAKRKYKNGAWCYKPEGGFLD